MKICHYDNKQAGVVVGDKVINFGDALIKAGLARQGYTMLEIIDELANNPAAMQIARDAANGSGGLDLKSVKLLAPIQNPGTLWAAAAIFGAHRAEMVDRLGSANKQIINKDDLMAEFSSRPRRRSSARATRLFCRRCLNWSTSSASCAPSSARRRARSAKRIRSTMFSVT
jgi:hypothetical protein